MASYELNYTVPSPGGYTTFIEFSPNGRFLVVGDRDFSSLYLLDRFTGFRPTLSAVTPREPTAVVWETSGAFYVGLADGRFTHYQIGLRGEGLTEGLTNRFFHGVYPALPITAMALDVESKTLVLSVGPEVFAFRRIGATSGFSFITKISNHFSFANDPGRPAPPFPRAICFTPNNTLVVTFCRQHIVSTVLKFERDLGLGSSFQTAEIDYSGLPLLKAITSENGEDVHRLTRCWIHGSAHQSDDNEHPFLFINGGAATLSSTVFGAAAIRDTVTHRGVQLLDHTGATGRRVSVMAYHVSKERYNIATVDRGENAMIKVWSARRTHYYPQDRSDHGFLTRKGWIATTLVFLSIVVMQRQVGRFPSVEEISRFVSQIALLFMQLCIQIGYTVLEAAEDAVLGLVDALD